MSALPNPEARAKTAGDEAYPADPERGVLYAEGYLRGWLDAVALFEQYETDPPNTVYGRQEGGTR
jgi:hypothetical protein